MNTKSRCLEFFPGPHLPSYAILSHTWAEEEVTFEHLDRDKDVSGLKGWEKICSCCDVATSLGFSYVWIDTCCIDKASSAELSEAINSMYRWYEGSGVCIAHLADVSSSENPTQSEVLIGDSRWFTRGWTLQELIAPSTMIFFTSDWVRIGTRGSLSGVIRDITGIPEDLLDVKHDSSASQQSRLAELSVGEKMRWAATRETTRPEDIAYCMLGIFNINMPLLYGEGRVKAFRRLQEEIIKSIDDETIFAWSAAPTATVNKESHSCGLLAEDPSAFGNYGDLIPRRSQYLVRRSNLGSIMSNRGLHIELGLTPFPGDKSGTIFLGFLDCDLGRGAVHSGANLNVAVLLQKVSWHNETEFVRVRPDVLVLGMMNHILLPDEVAAMPAGDEQKVRHVVLAEAVPRQVFIPYGLPVSRSPKGFLFKPYVYGVKNSVPYKVEVLSKTASWHRWVDNPNPEAHDNLEINFDLLPKNGQGSLSWVTAVGGLVLRFSRPNAKRSYNVRLAVGIDPPPENPFGVPNLHVAPWCALRLHDDTNASSELFEAADKDARPTYIDMWDRIQISFDLEGRYSRLYYQIKLEVRGVKTIVGFGSR